MDSLRTCSQGWDRSFLRISSHLSEPACLTYGLLRYRLLAPLEPKKFENCDRRVQEVAFRVLIVLSVAIAFPAIFCVVAISGLAARVCRLIGVFLQKGGYTSVLGGREEKILNREDPRLKIMTWNICALAAKMSLDHGGVIDWKKRIPEIIEKIQEEDPDVLLLQEVYDTACAERLVRGLHADYAHFFIHLGSNARGSNGGCFVATKCGFTHFSHTSFTNNTWILNRGFATLEIKADPADAEACARIIGTHLIHGDQGENRLAQIEQIVSDLERREEAVPTLLAGDLNMERDEEGRSLLAYVDHAYLGEESTCTGRLQIQWDPEQQGVVLDEKLDFISLFKTQTAAGRVLPSAPAELANCQLIEAYPLHDTKRATSDHRGLSVVMRNFQIGRR
ncbi:MAG: endonuclease/exonuclease/phosphatase family protein [Chlamydiales bacterium]|nr:endonuclease/exonuclease/phosphatase family protein [Chlamydiales bacterium]